MGPIMHRNFRDESTRLPQPLATSAAKRSRFWFQPASIRAHSLCRFFCNRREKSCVTTGAPWWDCPSVFPTVHGRTSYIFSSCVNPHISLPNLCLFTHAGKQLHLYPRVLVSGSQLAEETHKGKEQADMNFYWTRLWHRLRGKFAERRWVPGKEDVMAK